MSEISALKVFQLRRCWRDLEVDIDTSGQLSMKLTLF